MLTQKEILDEVFTLPVTAQLEIAEEIQNNLKLKNSNDEQKQELSIKERHEIVQKLSGIAKVDGKPAPTDEEVKEEYHNYLTEKYK
jgi:hypothetical protein